MCHGCLLLNIAKFQDLDEFVLLAITYLFRWNTIVCPNFEFLFSNFISPHEFTKFIFDK